MTWRKNGAMDLQTVATLLAGGIFIYAAWLTSIVFSAANGHGPLLSPPRCFPRSASCTVSACGSVDGENRRLPAVKNSWRCLWALTFCFVVPVRGHCSLCRPACG